MFVEVVLKHNRQHNHLNRIMNILHNYYMVMWFISMGTQANEYLMLTVINCVKVANECGDGENTNEKENENE